MAEAEATRRSPRGHKPSPPSRAPAATAGRAILPVPGRAARPVLAETSTAMATTVRLAPPAPATIGRELAHPAHCWAAARMATPPLAAMVASARAVGAGVPAATLAARAVAALSS